MVPSLCNQLKTFVFVLCFSVRLQAQIPAFQARDFHQADSIAARYPDHSLTGLKSLADKLTKPFSTDTDKFRAIYKWVCNNIENDYSLYVRDEFYHLAYTHPLLSYHGNEIAVGVLEGFGELDIPESGFFGEDVQVFAAE